jgi:hypothetical protein
MGRPCLASAGRAAVSHLPRDMIPSPIRRPSLSSMTPAHRTSAFASFRLQAAIPHSGQIRSRQLRAQIGHSAALGRFSKADITSAWALDHHGGFPPSTFTSSTRRGLWRDLLAQRPNSRLGQPRLAQGVERRLKNWLVVVQPFDRELGVEAASFSQRSACFVDFSDERLGGGQV